MSLSMLIYQYSDKIVLSKEKNEDLIKNIRKLCKSEIHKDYQSLEFTYESLDKYVKQINQKEI